MGGGGEGIGRGEGRRKRGAPEMIISSLHTTEGGGKKLGQGSRKVVLHEELNVLTTLVFCHSLSYYFFSVQFDFASPFCFFSYLILLYIKFLLVTFQNVTGGSNKSALEGPDRANLERTRVPAFDRPRTSARFLRPQTTVEGNPINKHSFPCILAVPYRKSTITQ